jgi:hypothetical protein
VFSAPSGDFLILAASHLWMATAWFNCPSWKARL